MPSRFCAGRPLPGSLIQRFGAVALVEQFPFLLPMTDQIRAAGVVIRGFSIPSILSRDLCPDLSSR